MFRKDYIMRQFEEFGKALAVLMGLRRGHDWERFEKEIESATTKFSGKDLGELETLSTQEFEALVLNHDKMTEEQIKMLGDLMFEKMLYYKETGNEKFEALKKKCLFIFDYYLSNLTQNQLDLGARYKLDLLKKLD
jgi:hypothetical protein